jgi:hypothetical protein
MTNFDDFSLGGDVGGVLPTYKNAVPTDVRTTRPFMTAGGPLPRFYYDFKAQARHHAHRRLGAKPKS